MPVLTEIQPSQWSRKSAINSLILLATCPCSGLHNPAGGDSLQARPNQSTSQPTKRLAPRRMRPGKSWCGHRLDRFKLLFVLCTHLYGYGFACTHACHVHVCNFKHTTYYSFWVCVLCAYCMCTRVFCVASSPLFEACFAPGRISLNVRRSRLATRCVTLRCQSVLQDVKAHRMKPVVLMTSSVYIYSKFLKYLVLIMFFQ